MSKQQRILLLNYEFPPLGGGGGVASSTLAKGFVEQGYKVDVVTTWYEGLEKFEKRSGVNIHRVKVLGRNGRHTASIISMLSFLSAAYRKTSELCEKYDYEFMNTHFAVPTGPLGVFISRKFNLDNILSIHGGDIYDPSKKLSPHRFWILRKIVEWVLNNSEVVVAQSTDTKENAIKYYQPDKDIEVIPLPYEPYEFEKVNRSELDLKENLFYTISIGRLVKRKGFDFLIRAIAETNEKVHALIIGGGPERKKLKDLAKKLNIFDRVHFLGSVSEEKKFQYLDNSDLYILSSMHEGFGIVLQEAMQVGLPIIATDNGGQNDLVEEDENGYLVEYGDMEELKRRIDSLLDNSALREEFSESNKQGLERFKIDRVCSKYVVF